MFSIDDECKKQPLTGYKSKTKIHLKFNKIVESFKKHEFKLSNKTSLFDKLNVLLQYDPNKLQLVLKHDSDIQKHYIHYIQHAFKNKQYKMLLYLFNNSHLYLKDLDYIIHITNDYREYLLKIYQKMFTTLEVILGIDSKNLNINQQRFIELTDLLVNIRKHREGFIKYPNLFDGMYHYIHGNTKNKLDYKKIVDKYISNFNCFQIWILSKILKKHDNDLLDLTKMIHYIFPDIKEPFVEVDIYTNDIDNQPFAYYAINNGQMANVYYTPAYVNEYVNPNVYANGYANTNIITTVNTNMINTTATNTITNYATGNTYYTNPVNYTYTGYLP